jgi:Carboxypeptidase regulatory-like domain
MKTKSRRTVFIIGFLAIVAILLIWRSWRSGNSSADLSNRESEKSVFQPTSKNLVNKEDGMSAFLRAFNQKIDLYGKVVDQHGNAIEGANIQVYANDKPFSDGGSPAANLVSDSSGRFTVLELKGISLGVQAEKKGFIPYGSTLGGPTSTANVSDSKHSNSSRPLILTLHDPGVMEPLVHQEDQRWKLPSDGTPQKIFLDSGNGQQPLRYIEFRFMTKRFQLPKEQLYGHPYDWSLEIYILGGGFVRNENDLSLGSYYQFEAPLDGYQEVIKYGFSAQLPKEKWKKIVTDSFFVRFSDGTYGRIRFLIQGSSQNSPLLMETWWNPKSGSRNLSSLYK